MPDQIASEPSMDEILASIRKIISEDPPAGGKTDAPDEAAVAAPEAETVVTSPAPAAADLSPSPEPAPASAPAREPLVGEPAAAATASAFESLAATADEAAKSRSSIALPPPGRSLEDLTADLLRPLLKAWLDEHLPEIVRVRVDEEVARIARSRVR